MRPRLRLAFSTALSLLAFVCGPSSAHARPGDLDPSFGSNGVVEQAYGALGAIDMQGRIYVGSAEPDPIRGSVSGLQRYLPNGTIDSNFAGDGFKEAPETDRNYGLGVDGPEIQPSGDLVSPCLLNGGEGPSRNCVWITTPDSPDPGMVIGVGPSGTSNTFPEADYSVGRLGDFAVAVTAAIPLRNKGQPHYRSRLFRFAADGSPTVNTNLRGRSIVRRHHRIKLGLPAEIAIDRDGGVLLLCDPGLVRLRQDGRLDRSFGYRGLVGGGWGAVTVDPQGRILLTGQSRSAQPHKTLTRFLPDGERDVGFGNAGAIALPQVFDPPSFIGSPLVAAKTDGGLILGFYDFGTPGRGISLVAVTPDGSVDQSFGDQGIAHIPLPDRSHLTGLQLDPRGRRLIASAEAISLETLQLHAYLFAIQLG
jgi:uncharacterized delta-60 repeat protein